MEYGPYCMHNMVRTQGTHDQTESTDMYERARLDEKRKRHLQHHRRPMRHRLGHPLPEIIGLPEERCAFSQLELTNPSLGLTSSHAIPAFEQSIEHPISLWKNNISPLGSDDMAAGQLGLTTEQPNLSYVYHTKSTQTDEP